MNEIRPTLVSSAKSQKEIPVLAAAQWKKLDESQKKKYNVLFEKENVRQTKLHSLIRHELVLISKFFDFRKYSERKRRPMKRV